MKVFQILSFSVTLLFSIRFGCHVWHYTNFDISHSTKRYVEDANQAQIFVPPARCTKNLWHVKFFRCCTVQKVSSQSGTTTMQVPVQYLRKQMKCLDRFFSQLQMEINSKLIPLKSSKELMNLSGWKQPALLQTAGSLRNAQTLIIIFALSGMVYPNISHLSPDSMGIKGAVGRYRGVSLTTNFR